MSKKESIFFVLIFVVLVLSINISQNGFVRAINHDILNMIIPFIAVIFLLIVYKMMYINVNIDNFELKNETDADIPLNTSDPYNLNTNIFEVTPAKQCEGGPYMWSSASPEKKKMCESISKEEIARYSCMGGMYVGRPITWENTPMSDDNWENHMCDDLDNNNTSTCPM